MSYTKMHIMIVDDQPTNLLVILDVLECKFRVTCVESGQDCLKVMEADAPDLVLMDVCMSGMSGYECCIKIKENSRFHTTPVIFLSAQKGITDKLKGYAAGAADYLTKPCDTQEIVAKIDQNLSLLSKFDNILKNANDSAHLAISNSGELSILLQFMEKSFVCENQDDLARLVLATFESYDLHSCIQLRGSHKTLNACNDRPVAPLEISLMTEVLGRERVVAFGHRFLCTSQNISIIIENLPDDKVLAERLKEYVISILNGATACIKKFNAAHEKEQKIASRLKKTLEDITIALTQINSLEDQKNQGISSSLTKFNEKINSSLSSLSLTTSQESHFLELLEKNSGELFKAANLESDFKLKFKDINSKIFNISTLNNMT
jgi:CheY-like chemotaxis protein